jgi:hypothetical protein
MTSVYEPTEPDAGASLACGPDPQDRPFGPLWQPVTLAELHAFARGVRRRFEASRVCGEAGERAGLLAEAELEAQAAWHGQFHDHRYGGVGEHSAPPLAWKGYVDLGADDDWGRCAVAHLGRGVFLVHSYRPQPPPWPGPDVLLDRFEVVAPCACAANRYRSDPVSWPGDLAGVLDQTLGEPAVCAGSCAASVSVRGDTAVGRSGFGR